MASGDPIDLTVNSPSGSAASSQCSESFIKSKPPTSALANLPPCRVCNAVASGYHYGANTCEACKAFFRRSIGAENSIRPCRLNGDCATNPEGKISCSHCRHKKCLQIGMAKKGCKKGRYTYEKRTQDTKELKRIQANKVITRNFELQNCEETVVMLAKQFAEHFVHFQLFIDRREEIYSRVNAMIREESVEEGQCLTRLHYSPGHAPSKEAIQWFEMIRAHEEASLYRLDEPKESLKNLQDMIFEVWTFHAEKMFYCLTGFAKNLTGFSDLLLDDKIILLKEGRTDSLSVLRHKCSLVEKQAVIHYNEGSGDIFLLPLSYMKDMLGEEFVQLTARVITRIQRLNLTAEDMAVLLAFVILTSDREGLQRSDLVERLQDQMLPVLQYVLKKNHPDQPNILADTILILPLLRECSVVSKNHLRVARSKVRAEVTPLLAEMIQDS